MRVRFMKTASLVVPMSYLHRIHSLLVAPLPQKDSLWPKYGPAHHLLYALTGGDDVEEAIVKDLNTVPLTIF